MYAPRSGEVIELPLRVDRYFALVVSGQVNLPSQQEMRRVAEEDQKDWERRFGYDAQRVKGLVDFQVYCDGIARAIGVFPPLTRLFFTRPWLWAKVLFGPLTTHQYRLVGPGADPARSEEVLEIHSVSCSFTYGTYTVMYVCYIGHWRKQTYINKFSYILICTYIHPNVCIHTYYIHSFNMYIKYIHILHICIIYNTFIHYKCVFPCLYIHTLLWQVPGSNVTVCLFVVQASYLRNTLRRSFEGSRTATWWTPPSAFRSSSWRSCCLCWASPSTRPTASRPTLT